MDPLVCFESVSYSIGGKPVLSHIDFGVNSGETLVLLGRSGSGKTTALKMVNALLTPTSGRVVVEGRATADWDAIRLRRRIGYVIQEVGLFPHYTVSQNVGLVPRLEGWSENRINARVNELLERVGLPPGEYAARMPRQLSGGQRQRVGVARALAADPDLLLFDEPFGSLDPITRLELQAQFLQLRGTFGKTAMFVTHDISEALKLGNRIAVLANGRIETITTPDGFFRAEGTESRAFRACLEAAPAASKLVGGNSPSRLATDKE